MFTVYDGNVYKINGDKMVGVNITPTSLEVVEGTETSLPDINTILTLRELRIKYQIGDGNSYIFPVEDIDKLYGTVDELTKKEIIMLLDEKEVKFNTSDNKDELYKILIES